MISGVVRERDVGSFKQDKGRVVAWWKIEKKLIRLAILRLTGIAFK